MRGRGTVRGLAGVAAVAAFLVLGPLPQAGADHHQCTSSHDMADLQFGTLTPLNKRDFWRSLPAATTTYVLVSETGNADLYVHERVGFDCLPLCSSELPAAIDACDAPPGDHRVEVRFARACLPGCAITYALTRAPLDLPSP